MSKNSDLNAMKARNEKIDFLRFVGLSMIILAHVNPHFVIFQLRNFDVPLMVIVSGMSFGLVFKEEPYIQYVWKRIKRLLFPTWIFLSFYLGANYLFNLSFVKTSFTNTINYYLLSNSADYVWIIRVFLLIALAAPFIMRWNQSVVSHRRYIVFLIGSLFVYELMRYLYFKTLNGQSIGELIEATVLYIIPYSTLFALGLRVPIFKQNTIYKIILGSLIVFLVIGGLLVLTTGDFIATQRLKYPPSIYFFSYAVFVSLSLWCVVQPLWKLFKKVNLDALILFIAQNSLWIYFWHIPLVKVVKIYFRSSHFLVKYGWVYILAVLITYVQAIAIHQVILPRIQNPQLKKNIKMLFTG